MLRIKYRKKICSCYAIIKVCGFRVNRHLKYGSRGFAGGREMCPLLSRARKCAQRPTFLVQIDFSTLTVVRDGAGIRPHQFNCLFLRFSDPVGQIFELAKKNSCDAQIFIT